MATTAMALVRFTLLKRSILHVNPTKLLAIAYIHTYGANSITNIDTNIYVKPENTY